MTASTVQIAGAGPIGAAFALLLVDRGLRADAIGLIDAREAEAAERDARLVALSESSRNLLAQLGAWPAACATEIHRIHVSHRAHFGRTVIDRHDYGLDALGHVLRYGDLVAALNAAMAARNLTVRRPSRIVSSQTEDATVRCELSDGHAVQTRYLVHAEGGLFQEQKAQSIQRDYGQTAIAAVVTTSFPQPNVAWERFTDAGPIALLPTAKDGAPALALVWCCTPADASRRMALADAPFLEELQQLFGDRLGRFLTVGARTSFPLGLNARQDIARYREFAIGNAAQTLHPVAGQGLNLGLRDAACLASLLCEHVDAPLTCMDHFAAARRTDRATTVNLTDLLARVFTSRLLPVAALRGTALALLDLAAPARQILARQMMFGQR